jgi:uncharacterized metal-binding protein YceD (DUF177 family)
MTEALPLTHPYNLARLGHAGDTVTFDADAEQRAAIARWSDVVSLERLSVAVVFRKLGATEFGLDFTVTVDVSQPCVVTLEPVPAHHTLQFHRELHFVGPARQKPSRQPPVQQRQARETESELDMSGDLDEGPEQIESLHYDLAGPVLEEYVLALEPYPRAPGVAFRPENEALDRPESPFAVLKALKGEL